MTPETLNDLLTRVNKLERQNRWFKRLALGLAIVAGTGLLMAAQDKPSNKPVETQHLSMRDADGNERGYMKATPDGLALVFTGGGGARTGVVVGPENVLIQVLDGAGKPLTGLSVQTNGVGMGYRGSDVGTDVGPNAIRAVLGQSLTPNPLLAKPR